MTNNYFENYDQLAPARSVLQGRTFYKGQKPDANSMREAFAPDELARIIYMPFVIAEEAIRTAEKGMRMLAERRVSGTLKMCRKAKEQIQEYRRAVKCRFEPSDMRNIEHISDLFRQQSAMAMQNLWFSINGDLKKHHPEMQDYEPWTTLHMSLHLFSLVNLLEAEYNKKLSKRMNIRFDVPEDIHMLAVAAAIVVMLEDVMYSAGKHDFTCMTILENIANYMKL